MVSVYVRLYPINVKMAEPIAGPNLCGISHDPSESLWTIKIGKNPFNLKMRQFKKKNPQKFRAKV